jgi:hypothetical protein
VFTILNPQRYYSTAKRLSNESSSDNLYTEVLCHIFQYSEFSFDPHRKNNEPITEHTNNFMRILLLYYCILLTKLLSYSVVWWGIVPEPTIGKLFPREKSIICLVHNISCWTLMLKNNCAEVNSSAFTLTNINMLTANDKQTTAPFNLREVNLGKNI